MSKTKFQANGIYENLKAFKGLLDMLYLPHSVIQIIIY